MTDLGGRFTQHDDIKPVTVSHTLTIPEQMALLKLRHSGLCKSMLGTLRERGHRYSFRDFHTLERLGYAAKRADNTWHEITPAGLFVASVVIKALAAELGITLERVKGVPRRRSNNRGLFSQAGNA